MHGELVLRTGHQIKALSMENLSIGQDITECLVHGELYLRTGQMSALCMEYLPLGQDINKCFVHGELALMTEHQWVPFAWRTRP